MQLSKMGFVVMQQHNGFTTPQDRTPVLGTNYLKLVWDEFCS